MKLFLRFLTAIVRPGSKQEEKNIKHGDAAHNAERKVGFLFNLSAASKMETHLRNDDFFCEEKCAEKDTWSHQIKNLFSNLC